MTPSHASRRSCRSPLRPLISLAALLLAAGVAPAQSAESPQGQRGEGVPNFWVRPGLKVSLAADNLGEARFMEFDGFGNLYYSSPRAGTLTLLSDPDPAGKYRSKTVIVSGRNRLHGLHFADDGYLYFTTSAAIFRFKPVAPTDSPQNPKIETVIPEGQLPQGGGHWWRSIVVRGGYLWTSIGDSGNINDETATERQKIWRFKIGPDGTASDKTLWSTGIRNTEKLRFRPGTEALYGADHGSDNIGSKYGENGKGGPITDMFPPDEFNRYARGLDYGHPFITGLGLPRPEFAGRDDVLELVRNNTPPVWSFGAHNAPNGWTFAEKDTLGLKGDAIVAFHGSWNATKKVGYKVSRVCFDPATGRPYGELPLVVTINDSGSDVMARPVDVVETPTGDLLFSDDTRHRIFRISKGE